MTKIYCKHCLHISEVDYDSKSKCPMCGRTTVVVLSSKPKALTKAKEGE